MKLKTIAGSENYAAVVVQITNLYSLDGLDRLQATQIHGNQVLVGLDVNIGDKGLYFAPGSRLATKYMWANNLHRDNTLNADTTKIGFFEPNGRLKALTFRKQQSAGLFMPMQSLVNYPDIVLTIGDEFNEIDGQLIVDKYIPPAKQCGVGGKQLDPKKKVDRFNRVIPDQFRFHSDTSQFAMNLHIFKLSDIVVITHKLHGTSAVFANVLVNRPLGIISRFLRWAGFDIPTTEYGHITSSRKVIKQGKYLDIEEKDGFYGSDVWGQTAAKIKDKIAKGYTLYGEIVGFLENGKAIQSMSAAYDYGCSDNTSQLYIYRITYTTPQGDVIELSWQQIKDYCESHRLTIVPEAFHGTLWEWVTLNNNSMTSDDVTMDSVLNDLKESYLERNCSFCKYAVPAEGIVIRLDGRRTFSAYKLKSFRFLSLETNQETQSIEDEN